jgi:hypothetical protein
MRDLFERHIALIDESNNAQGQDKIESLAKLEGFREALRSMSGFDVYKEMERVDAHYEHDTKRFMGLIFN